MSDFSSDDEGVILSLMGADSHDDFRNLRDLIDEETIWDISGAGDHLSPN